MNCQVRNVHTDKMKITAGFGRLYESVTSIMKGFAMKFGNVLLSSVLAFGLSTVALAEFADNFSGTQTGTWGTASWQTGSRWHQPGGGSLAIVSSQTDWQEAKLLLDLGSGRIASDIETGGGFTVEFDVDMHSVTTEKKADSTFYMGREDGSGHIGQINGWHERYAYRESGQPVVHGPGFHKYEFTITEGTWGTGTVTCSVRGYEDAGSGYAEFTPQSTTASFTFADGLYVAWQATAAPDSSGSYANLTLGNDLPGGVGLKITPFPDPHPEKARTPVPGDGADEVAPDVVLSWFASYLVTEHDVYFGTDAVAVSNATMASGEYKGRQSSTSFEPEGPIPGTEDLVLGVRYYWRVDEIIGANVYEGLVWNFTVTRRQAQDPSPSSGTEGVGRDVVLSWSPGPLTDSHDVYFGTNKALVTIAEKTWDEYRGNQTHVSYDPPEQLQLGRTYY